MNLCVNSKFLNIAPLASILYYIYLSGSVFGIRIHKALDCGSATLRPPKIYRYIYVSPGLPIIYVCCLVMEPISYISVIGYWVLVVASQLGTCTLQRLLGIEGGVGGDGVMR